MKPPIHRIVGHTGVPISATIESEVSRVASASAGLLGQEVDGPALCLISLLILLTSFRIGKLNWQLTI